MDKCLSTKIILRGGKKGEFLQGETINGQSYLLACSSPFLHSLYVEYKPNKCFEFRSNFKSKNTEKTKLFLKLLLQELKECSGKWDLLFDIPEKIGSGCATSSIMLQLVYKAVYKIKKINLKQFFFKIKHSVEGNLSDYILNFPKTFIWDFKGGKNLSKPLTMPEGSYISISSKFQQVSSLDMVRQPYSLEENLFFTKALKKIEYILKNNDIESLGELSEYSAIINQKNHYKEELCFFQNLKDKREIDGFCVAHSGTVLTMFHKDIEKMDYLYNKTKNYFNDNEYITTKFIHTV